MPNNPKPVILTQEGDPVYPVTDASLVMGLPDVPPISTDIATDATSDTKTTSPKAVKTFVENKGYGTYSKPSGGIPAGDLASGVIPTVPTALSQLSDDSTHRLVTDTEKSTWSGKQNALTFDSTPTADSTNPVTSGGVKAYVDGAIPSVPTISTDIAADATSDTKTASPKAVKTYVDNAIPTVPTALSQLSDDSTHRLVTDTEKSTWSGKQNALTFDSTPTADSTNPVTSGGVKAYVDGAIPTVPTISTDIQTDKASTTKTASPSAVYNEVHPAFGSSQPAGGMLPNVLYKLGTLTGTVSISFAAASDATIENEYKFTFTAGSTAPTITWPAAITGWAGNCVEDGAPVITGGNYYEVSVMDGIALIAEVEA